MMKSLKNAIVAALLLGMFSCVLGSAEDVPPVETEVPDAAASAADTIVPEETPEPTQEASIAPEQTAPTETNPPEIVPQPNPSEGAAEDVILEEAIPEEPSAGYVITIPASVALDAQTGAGILTLTAVGLSDEKPLSIRMTSQNGFKLRAGERELEYTVSGDSVVATGDGGATISFSGDGSVSLRLATVASPEGWGKYQDVLTFCLNEE